MAGRKVRSYLGGPLVDPNRPCYSWWDYIMSRRSLCDSELFRGSRFPILPGQTPGRGAPLVLTRSIADQEWLFFNAFPVFTYA